MKQLIFSTSNISKFIIAEQVCTKYDIEIIQKQIDVVEIQAEDPVAVALDKSAKAYDSLKMPLLISDDSWAFLGLNGFPGIYMHSMNTWLTSDDFLRLTLPLKDRRVVFTQYVVYNDGVTQKTFTAQTPGLLLTEIRGQSEHPSHTIVSLVGDNGKSLAEAFPRVDNSTTAYSRVWHDFAKWYQKEA
jgi:inosine/xanthosine triphosphate pyrophosphatase family protein